MNSFPYPPTPQILHWLAAGQLANRLQRSIRLWVILNKLYGEENCTTDLPKNFTYAQLRDRLYSPHHPKSEKLNAEEITTKCQDITCICHQTAWQIIQISNCHISETEWQQEILQLTGINIKQLQELQQQRPFATVHRSIRDDLKQLTNLGWLQTILKGQYQILPKAELPAPTTPSATQTTFTQLSLPQTWELLHVLESIAFVQPNLDIIIQSLWEQILDHSPSSSSTTQEPQQRIFLHLDYILSPEMQDQVDNYQEQLEQLWRKPPGGVVQFEYWIAKTESKVEITVYPVCLHYLRRAKYLSAYGLDPQGNLTWHNYRLDRIASEKLQILAWGDPAIPKQLKEMWHIGNLPTPEYVQSELEKAWGFNFYLKRELLIIRFPSAFAHWYVDNTFRHHSFRRIAFEKLPNLITTNIPAAQQQEILGILKQRNNQDVYYMAWIRTGDINVLMRLRDWRPNGEVISPLSIRQQLKEEAIKELSNYNKCSTIDN
ncbi:TIGR03985 family CRISPR-associated protein [Sphaerospermopsis aphanizomenoides BCCUSP55]|uniref:TIGR03985 family CRISPR-associated protein n=1 Tax=Sphaerospermopsis aphanizomenoides TaxID=459663 RepID=UPI0019047078|nr:TIGR03985 family CRISPR-associated protein [Sphaerospermopsis aphanizomenoides]MBK1986915.1 TIGR03985 family CRISPR-associated protein [Sphaerospermopsis aphanizomenoides BCCUSP55]